MSPAIESACPTTCCETIDTPPSLIAAQPAPRPPSGRLKSSSPGCDVVWLVHVTATPVTFADATVPDAPDAVHVWPLGLLLTVML